MRELRQDPLTGAWMALCEERVSFGPPPESEPDGPAACPFCHPTVAPLGQRGTARAWPHHLPALRVEEGSERVGPGRRPGLGAHEVVVASPRHAPVHHLSIAEAVDAFVLAMQRMQDLRGDHRLGRQGWSRRARPGGHGRDTVAAWPDLPGLEPLLSRDAVAYAVSSAQQQGRELGGIGSVHAWCSRAPQRPFEVRLAWLGNGPATEQDVADLARTLHAVEHALEAEVGPHGHDARLRPGAAEGTPSLLAGCLEVAPCTRWVSPPLAGVLPTHAASPERVAPALRDRFRQALCHDANQGEVPR